MAASQTDESHVPEENLPTSAGLSSYNLLDEQRLFTTLGLAPGMIVLDFGCGLGNYAVACAPRVGEQGVIHALDPWDEGIETLEVRAARAGLANIRPLVVGKCDRLPLADQSVDFCLLATVLHILVLEGLAARVLPEVRRVLRPGATLAVVEFHKREGPPGPPLAWRLAPSDLAALLAPHAFVVHECTDVGPHNYLARYVLRI
jgi:ubiquinone/menaquinone biosynthesis C-methylase UbiE